MAFRAPAVGVLSVSLHEWHSECSMPRPSAADAIWVRDGCFIHPELVPERRQWEGNAALEKSAQCLANFELHHGLRFSFVFVDYILPSFMFLCEHWNSTEHTRGWVGKFPSSQSDQYILTAERDLFRSSEQTSSPKWNIVTMLSWCKISSQQYRGNSAVCYFSAASNTDRSSCFIHVRQRCVSCTHAGMYHFCWLFSLTHRLSLFGYQNEWFTTAMNPVTLNIVMTLNPILAIMCLFDQ